MGTLRDKKTPATTNSNFNDASIKAAMQAKFDDTVHLDTIMQNPDDFPELCGVLLQIQNLTEDMDNVRLYAGEVQTEVTANTNRGSGTDGSKGDAGSKGDKGEAGDAGSRGATGAKGDKGDKGDTGETGAAGSAGAKGDKGDTGDKGATGDAGAKGDTGAAGADGSDGSDGAAGAKGDKGKTGNPGANGSAGKDGADGSVPITEGYKVVFNILENRGAFSLVISVTGGDIGDRAKTVSMLLR